MAASIAWRNRLKNHKIFSDLAESNKSLNVDDECLNLTVIKDGEIYVWNPYNACVMTTNLKNLILKNESDDGFRVEYQTLMPHSPPRFSVSRLLMNAAGTLLALAGKRGLTVLEIPQRWGRRAEFQGGKDRILCKTISVGERQFLGSRGCLLDVCWHPGSETDTHITILSADNTIRVYSIEDPEFPAQTYPLYGGEDGDDADGGTGSVPSYRASLATDRALGENAVAFDFGQPIELRRKNKCSGEEKAACAWPMYILMGNGDVVMQLASFDNFRRGVVGPLHMYPPAEDNYGTDACSILCLASTPGVVVIATAEGRLYHAVLLANPDKLDASIVEVESGPGSMYITPPPPSLYVYESIELELSLTTYNILTDTTDADDAFTCPIHLLKDGVSEGRYHCCHAAGVHSVALPWMDSLEQFTQDQAEEDRVLDESQHAIVEHILCTKPLPSSPPSPMLGLAMTSDRLLGPTLVCLTHTLQCVILPMLMHYRSPPPALFSDSPARQGARSPLRSVYSQSLDQQVRQTLKRNASNPLLKSDPSTTLTPQECFQLLTRATQVFREEYVQKQDQARDQIERRLLVLNQQKTQQQEEVVACLAAKNVLCDAAHGLAAKLEECKERHESMINRLEAVHRKLQGRLPVSEAESNMKKELLEAEAQIAALKANIKQLKAKQAYQEKQFKLHEQRCRPMATLTPKQTESLKGVLKQEGSDIGNLVKQVSDLKVTLDL